MSGQFEQFEALAEEKRQRVLNAALKEFAQHKFKNASTDNIAAGAGISKGALFLYFGTKRGLYLYLCRYVVDTFRAEFGEKPVSPSRDPIGVLEHLTRIKMDILAVHPDMYDFLMAAYLDEGDDEVRALMHGDADVAREKMLGDMLSNLDYSRFHDGFDPGQVMDVIRWVVDGFTDFIVRKLKSGEPGAENTGQWLDRFDETMGLLRRAFYKEEYQS